MEEVKNSASQIKCFLCKYPVTIKIAKDSRPYWICNMCGIQVFIRGRKAIGLLNRFLEGTEDKEVTMEKVEPQVFPAEEQKVKESEIETDLLVKESTAKAIEEKSGKKRIKIKRDIISTVIGPILYEVKEIDEGEKIPDGWEIER